MSMDLRTRRDGEVAAVEPRAFLDVDLPALLDGSCELLSTTTALELRPLVVEVGEDSWLLSRADDGRIEVVRAEPDEARLRLRLSPDQLADLVNDQITPVGLMTAATLDLEGGGIGRVMDWWLVLRCVLDQTPVHTPGSVDLPDDLGRSFTLADDPADIRDYLEAAGYVHLRGVFTTEEMARVSDEMDAAAPGYAPDDGNSWWATVADGTRRLVRMQRFDEVSPTAAALLCDPRFTGLGDLLGGGYEPRLSTGNRIEALFKPLGITEGISDVPWHKDCSLGRHSYECCRLTIGISVTGAGPTTGQLRVIAGSHRALVWPSLLDPAGLDLPDVALATETGDLTVHLSCTLHMAQPPTEDERRVLYTDLQQPPFDEQAAMEGARRLFKTSREGAPRNTSQAATV
jgi:hypothetical protein